MNKIPTHLCKEKNPILAFNKAIIDATLDYTIAYKPNTAFYESLGSLGWEILHETMRYIPDGVFKIVDAKRGDIGNTSDQYAKAFYEELGADALTLSPYMGSDSVSSYLKYKNKWVIVLAKTTNPSSSDFQNLEVYDKDNFFDIAHRELYKEVINQSLNWANEDQLMFVVGGNDTNALSYIRKVAPSHFFLVPGIGVQGADLEELTRVGMNELCGLIVNASRSIIYASDDEHYAQSAAQAAQQLQQEMKGHLDSFL